MQNINIPKCLGYIDPSSLTYQEWISVGMALKESGRAAAEWDAWSKQDVGRYHDGECFEKWATFNGAAAPVTAGTIVQMAQERGWSPSGEALDWDSEIGYDSAGIVDAAYLEVDEIREPSDAQWNPVDEIRQYLQVLFRSDEHVGYLTDTWNKDGKWVPASGGNSDRTAGQLIGALNRCKGDIGAVFGDANREAGAWIRFNPLDGNGVKNDNVTDLRYALVESDKIEPEKQLAIIRALELPCAAIVHSGNKSIHAIVRIDAGTDKTEYRRRVEYLYSTLKKNGLECDEQNKNPSRLSRMPGIMRGNNKQHLISVNEGKSSWAEWCDWYDDEEDRLPEFDAPPTEKPKERPVLICGLLRDGDKMMLSGPSKAGKSFALIELSIAIARGIPWLGWQCSPGKVLYVNLELQRDSCLNRFYELSGGSEIRNLDIWNLRGEAMVLKDLMPKLIRRTKDKSYRAIILDPIYKIMGGDENNAEQVSKFCNNLDKICKETGAAIIYCHHHSKGAQGGKNAIDRASGSGVFARDADALMDMIQLRLAKGEETFDGMPLGATAWRIEMVLRDFEDHGARDVWFVYPRHVVDPTGRLAACKPDTGGSWTVTEMNDTKSRRREELRESAIAAFDRLVEESEDGGVPLQAICNITGYTPDAAAKFFDEDAYTIKPPAKNRYKDGVLLESTSEIRRRTKKP